MSNPTIRYSSAWSGLFFITLASAQSLTTTITVTDPRPLAQIALELEHRHGLRINYEDPPYAYSGDIKDLTKPGMDVTIGHRVMIPAGGSLAITYAVLANAAVADPDAVVSLLPSASQKAGLGGIFRIIKHPTAAAYTIAPTEVKSSSGSLITSASPFDVPVTFSDQTMSGMAAIELVCKLASSTAHTHIAMATVPTNLLVQKTIMAGSNNETARDVLLRVLDGLAWGDTRITIPRRKLAWQLLYDPGSQTYFFNLHIVSSEQKVPNGGTVLRPIV